MMTFNAALEVLAAGNEARAFEIAQRDEGLNAGVTMTAWVAFARNALANRAASAAAYAAPMCHG